MEVIKTNTLSFRYPGSKEYAVDDISVTVFEGEFVVLCGESGSGKTTLQSLLKPEIAPKGEISGEIQLFGKDIKSLDSRESAEKIGFISQNVEYQIVNHTVRNELAFGLQNIGLSNNEITSIIAETAEYFGLSAMMDERVDTLSGGTKQLLVLASQCAMHPKLLILDEPTSQLDPIAAERLLTILRKLCDEYSMTVLISEHRLHNVIPLADKLIVLEGGKVIFDGLPEDIDLTTLKESEFLSFAVPSHMRLCLEMGAGKAPVTLAQGRRFFRERLLSPKHTEIERNGKKENGETAISVKHLYYSYDAENYVLKDFSLRVNSGTIFALMGENGAGKTTALRLLCGSLRSKKGKICFFGKASEKSDIKLAYLPQRCEALFAGMTIREDMQRALKNSKCTKEEKEKLISVQADFFDLGDILERHPYDVSGGQMQKSALAMLMLLEPDIIFLDEPTKGMDNVFKHRFGEKLKQLAKQGRTIFMVCHDTEFCAEYADECALLFDGAVISQQSAKEFFSENYFYTTSARKMTSGIFKNAVTEDEVLDLWRKNLS